MSPRENCRTSAPGASSVRSRAPLRRSAREEPQPAHDAGTRLAGVTASVDYRVLGDGPGHSRGVDVGFCCLVGFYAGSDQPAPATSSQTAPVDPISPPAVLPLGEGRRERKTDGKASITEGAWEFKAQAPSNPTGSQLPGLSPNGSPLAKPCSVRRRSHCRSFRRFHRACERNSRNRSSEAGNSTNEQPRAASSLRREPIWTSPPDSRRATIERCTPARRAKSSWLTRRPRRRRRMSRPAESAASSRPQRLPAAIESARAS